MKRNREIIFGAIVLAFGIVYFALALQIPEFHDGNLSSDFMPKVYGVLLMLLCAAQIWQGLRKGAEKQPQEALVVPEVIATFTLLILYVALLKPLGFTLSSILFLLCLITLFTPAEDRKKPKTIVSILLISILFSIAVNLIFTRGFTLSLPEGTLF